MGKYVLRFEAFQAVVDTTGNFRNYRRELAEKAEFSVAIPYIGILSKFLFAVEESNPTFVGNNKSEVNFTKLRLLYNQLQDVKANQAPLASRLDEIVELQLYLEQVVVLEKEAIFAKSYELEPKEVKS